MSRVIFRRRARGMYAVIRPFLRKDDSVLDIGAGDCTLCESLHRDGYRAAALDVQDQSIVDGIVPVIYDGNEIPFADDAYDVALLITVLHHTPDPEKVLQEARRVAKRIIVTEDVYSNTVHRYLTYFFDSLINFEFIGHPHTNRSDGEWRETFARLRLRVVDVQSRRTLMVFAQATYHLEREEKGLEIG